MNRDEIEKAVNGIDENFIVKAAMYQPRKQRRWQIPTIVAACLCLCIGAGMGMHRIGVPKKNIGVVSDRGEQKKGTEKPTFIVNKGDGIAKVDMDAEVINYIGRSKEELARAKEEFQTSTALDFEQVLSKVPMGYQLIEFTSLGLPNKKTGGYTVHDYTLSFENGEKRIVLSLSSQGKPIEDVIIASEEEQKPSYVHGHEVIVYAIGDHYYGEFQLNGVYYKLQTEGLSLEAFQELLLGQIAQ